MDESSRQLALVVGSRVRQEGQSRRWTLDHLAETAGVSRRMVVNVEQGAANPSVATLLRLSDALGIGLPALVEPPRAKVVNRSFGAKPQRTRNSLEALLRRASTGLPRVNRLTDIYNAVSVLHQVPLGGEDLTRYVGAPHLVRATGHEPSTPWPTAVMWSSTPMPARWCGATTPA